MKVALQVSQAWPDVEHVYNVGYNGVCIGRVWFDRSAGASPWEWLISLPMQLPESSVGRAAGRKEALKAFAAEWAKLINQTPKSRLERVLKFARDLESPPAREAASPDVPVDKAIGPVEDRTVPPPLPPLAAASPSAQVGAPNAGAADIERHGPTAARSDESVVPAIDDVPAAEQKSATDLPSVEAATAKNIPMLTIAAVNHPSAPPKLPRDLQTARPDQELILPAPGGHKQPASGILRDIVAVLSRHA